MRKILILSTMIFSFITIANEKSPPTLKTVMQDLGKAMNKLNEGIFTENFDIIVDAASSVANHPKPKSQLSTIIKTLNFRVIKFKGYDGEVHDAAIDIITLAKKKDMPGILKKHKVIMNNCVTCHSQFKNEISKALNN